MERFSPSIRPAESIKFLVFSGVVIFLLGHSHMWLIYLFIFLNHWFITRGAEAGHGKYTVPT